jgi:hypothetical protein
MLHSLNLARSPRDAGRPDASRHDDDAHNPLARFSQGSHSTFAAPAARDSTNHCAGCVNADTALCGPCIAEARWQDGGLPHFRPVSSRAAEPEARAA